jgi:hypothetical protein
VFKNSCDCFNVLLFNPIFTSLFHCHPTFKLFTFKLNVMKTIFTFLTSVLFISSGFAFSNRLTISSSYDRTNIRVQVDGRYVQQSRNSNENEIAIDDLRAGYHNIKVYSSVKRKGDWGNNNNSNMELLYSGNINVRNGYHTDIVINRFGKAFVDEQRLDNYNNGNNNNNNKWNWNAPAMNERSFEQLKQSIRRESFAKTAVRDQAVSTSQVRELLGLFSFEQNKLDIAKYCYHYTTDYNNYYLVANSFGFSSSKNELLKYIDANRRQ